MVSFNICILFLKFTLIKYSNLVTVVTIFVYTLSHISADVVNLENQKFIPNILSVKHFLNFIPVSLLIDIFPVWCNVKFSLPFCIVQCSENRHKISIAPYRDIFII